MKNQKNTSPHTEKPSTIHLRTYFSGSKVPKKGK